MSWKGRYRVLVGNVGEVFAGCCGETANKTFAAYVHTSKAGHGKVAGQDVFLMRKSEVIREYYGTASRERNLSVNQ